MMLIHCYKVGEMSNKEMKVYISMEKTLDDIRG